MITGGGQSNWGPWPVTGGGAPVVLPGQIKVTSADPVADYISVKMESTEHTIALTVDATTPDFQRFNVEVAGIRDTTGDGTTLPIQTVPDSVDNDTVLIRPAGQAKVVGASADTLRVYKERYLPFCLVNLNPIGNPGYAKTSDPGNLTGTAVPMYPLGVTATKARLMFHVDDNDLVTNAGLGLISFQYYINGVLVGSTTATTDVAPGTVIDTGFNTLLGATAPTDVWSVRIASTGTYTSGGIWLSGGLIVGYINLE
jgi:hypothetical protein